MPKYGINKATLMGNVGTEPELRYLDQGVAVCNFRLATTERYKMRDGQWGERTDWHNIVLWRQRAELAQKYLRVGSGIYIEGRIVNRSWDGPDGQKRYKTEIEVEKMRLLDPPPAGGATAAPGTGANTGAQNPPPAIPPKAETPATPVNNPDDGTDDLPF